MHTIEECYICSIIFISGNSDSTIRIMACHHVPQSGQLLTCSGSQDYVKNTARYKYDTKQGIKKPLFAKGRKMWYKKKSHLSSSLFVS